MDFWLMYIAMLDWFRRRTIRCATKAVKKVAALVEECDGYKDTLEYNDFKAAVRKIVFPKKKKNEDK